jgi:hypothetical protein
MTEKNARHDEITRRWTHNSLSIHGPRANSQSTTNSPDAPGVQWTLDIAFGLDSGAVGRITATKFAVTLHIVARHSTVDVAAVFRSRKTK